MALTELTSVAPSTATKLDAHNATEIINDLSQTYEFATVALMTSSSIVFPDGKPLKTKEFIAGTGAGGASYIKKSGGSPESIGSPNLTGGGYAAIQEKGISYASQYGLVAGAVSDPLLDVLMSLGNPVFFEDGEYITTKTINFQGNTIWYAINKGAVTFKANHAGYIVLTTGNTGICGTSGINYDGDGQAESLVQFNLSNKIIAEYGHATGINQAGATNYRGAWIFNGCTEVIYGQLSASDILQTSNGEFQSFSFIDCNLNGWGTCKSNNSDKLFHTSGVVSGNGGLFMGLDLTDNVAYFLGAPKNLTVSFDGKNYEEGIVWSPTTTTANVYIPSIELVNGTSRVCSLRDGGGLRVGKLVSKGSFTGITDGGFTGSQNCQFEDVYLEGVTNQRPLYLQASHVRINRFRCEDSNVTEFNEICRIEGTANVSIQEYEDDGGTCPTAIRINAITGGGYLNIGSIKTDKVPVVYLASTNFAEFVSLAKINGFEVEGNSPDTQTISAGTITVSSSYHKLDTEGGASIDNIDTINFAGQPVVGAVVTFQSVSNLRDPNFTHNVGNIFLQGGADVRLNSMNAQFKLRWDGNKWTDWL